MLGCTLKSPRSVGIEQPGGFNDSTAVCTRAGGRQRCAVRRQQSLVAAGQIRHKCPQASRLRLHRALQAHQPRAYIHKRGRGEGRSRGRLECVTSIADMNIPCADSAWRRPALRAVHPETSWAAINSTGSCQLGCVSAPGGIRISAPGEFKFSAPGGSMTTETAQEALEQRCNEVGGAPQPWLPSTGYR